MRADIEENRLYTAAETRQLDRQAIEVHGIPGIRLMARAGRASFDVLLSAWGIPAHVHVLCGTGNNGGDGFIVATLAQDRGIPCTVYQLGDSSRIEGDALLARKRAEAAGLSIVAFSGELVNADGVVVDALLGTGLSGPARADYASAIGVINASELPVLAIDIPSGLSSDSGSRLGPTVIASHTVTFIGLKRGLFTGAAAACVGQLHYADLKVPADTYAAIPSQARRLELGALLALLPERPRDAHKGNFGHALVVGGDHGMAGAALLAAEAAARCGAGLVSLATRDEHVAAVVARRPEVMARGVAGGIELLPLLGRATAIAIGPGLGQSSWSEQLFYRALQESRPLVVDADALNLLARGPVERRENWILTPHPGEAARLLGVDTAVVQADRFAACGALQQRYGGVVLLKGAGTLVSADGDMAISEYGNPGMASGGMGDVLSGVLLALMAQGLSVLQAAQLGACLHGRAAELAATEGLKGLLAADLMPHLRRLAGS